MLTEQHQQFLDAAAISRDMQAGIESTDDGIRFPLRSITGRVLWQFRPDVPLVGADGKPVKYLTPPGEEVVLPVPPGMEERVGSVQYPLIVCEGTKQHLALASVMMDYRHPDTQSQYGVVGLLGCNNWMTNPTGEAGQGHPIQDLYEIPFLGRTVFLAFDADITSNRNVWDAAEEFGQHL